MKLYPPSAEQSIIIEKLHKSNINVDAVAGSGKTTTNLHIAKKYPKSSILLLTYNKDLKFDSRKKVDYFNIHNLEVHSYHSFCVKNYYNKAFDDNGIIKILKDDMITLTNFRYDIIILDEVQDLNSLYYELICKISLDNEKVARICVLGDRNQCINIWNGSDWRFIKYPEIVFNFNNDDWEICNLSRSFRITDKMAKFINNCMLNNDRINSEKRGSIPNYIICDAFDRSKYNRTYIEVMNYIGEGYCYEDFFILAPSLKSGSKIDPPVRQLANLLSNSGIPIYVPNSDEEELDKREIMGKMVFSTFHQVKGRERKIIIVFNFDSSYFSYYAKDKNPFECPNELYVACTRGLEKLSLIHHYQNDYLQFLHLDNLESNINLYRDTELIISNTNSKNNLETSVTELTKHLPSRVMEHCLSYFTKTAVQNKDDFINIPRKTKQGNLIEGVSEITGIAIPTYFELINKKTMSIYDELVAKTSMKLNDYGFIPDSDDESEVIDDSELALEKINLENITPDELLFISNKWNSYKSGYTFKLNQIINYNWLSRYNLDNCIERLTKHISNSSLFEVRCTIEDQKELLNRKLKGFFDCVDNNKLWELKCVKTLRNEHYLQLAIYMYMHKKELEILKDSKNNLQINEGDIVKFKINNNIPYMIPGTVNNICKNGRIQINFKNKCYTVDNHLIVKNLSLENKLEKTNLVDNYKYLLFNILSNEIFELDSNLNDLEEMMNYLIRHKYFNIKEISDKQFLEKNEILYTKYYSVEE